MFNQFVMNRSLLFYPTTHDELVQQLGAFVTGDSMPWLVWTNGWGIWQRQSWISLEQRISGVSPDVVCLALVGELVITNPSGNLYKLRQQGPSQQGPSQQGPGQPGRPVVLPVLWRTNWLRKRLSTPLPVVPTPHLLNFALYQQLLPKQQLEVDLSEIASGNEIQIRSPQDLALLDHTLPILSCTAPTVAPTQRRNAAAKERIPLTSVLISTYNAGKRLSWAIQSVFAQDQGSWELIVADDGSTDMTQDLLHTFRDERLHVVRLTVNRGKAHALNEGLRVASGRYICELDADDWLAPAALNVFASEMEARNDTVSILSGSYHLWLENSLGHITYKQKEEPHQFEWNVQSATPPIPRFYRTSALREIKGWPVDDPSQGRLFEDVAVCTKLALRHKDAIQVTNQALYHRVLRRTSISQQHRALYSEWAKKWQTHLTEEYERNRRSELEP